MTLDDSFNLPDEKIGRHNLLDSFLYNTRDRILLDLSVSLSSLPPSVHHDTLIPGYLRNRLKLVFSHNPPLLPDLFSLLEICRDVLNNPVSQDLVLTDQQVIDDLLSRSSINSTLPSPPNVQKPITQDPDNSELLKSVNRIEEILLSQVLYPVSQNQHQLNYLRSRGIL